MNYKSKKKILDKGNRIFVINSYENKANLAPTDSLSKMLAGYKVDDEIDQKGKKYFLVKRILIQIMN